MTIRAALLDENDVFMGVVELADETMLTNRHLPKVTNCDLPPGQYKWVADTANQYGGAFWPVKWLNRVEQDKLDVKAANEAAQRLAARRIRRKAERGEK